MASDALLERMVRAIVEEVDPEQVILFGSRARGDATAESDFDFIVVEAGPFDAGRSRHCEEVRLYPGGVRRFHGHSGLLPRRRGILARLPESRPRAGVAGRQGAL